MNTPPHIKDKKHFSEKLILGTFTQESSDVINTPHIKEKKHFLRGVIIKGFNVSPTKLYLNLISGNH